MADLYSAGLRRRIRPSPVQKDVVFGQMTKPGAPIAVNAKPVKPLQGLRKPVKPTSIIGTRG